MSIEVALQDVFMEFASHKTGGLNNNAQHEFLISIDSIKRFKLKHEYHFEDAV
jgi:hypothetical protein